MALLIYKMFVISDDELGSPLNIDPRMFFLVLVMSPINLVSYAQKWRFP
jgi:hypothetical protein